MPGRPLTAAQAALGATPEGRAKAERTRTSKNAITWLRRQVEQSKLPEEVKARADKLFKSIGTPMQLYLMDDEQAQQAAFRISARIHWLRSTHRMLAMDPSESGFMGVSKTAAQWTLIDAKLNERKGKGSNGHTDRRPVVTPSTTRSPEADDDQGGDNGDTA